MSAPKWMGKHPCVACGTGYGACSQGWTRSLMCCEDCDHPGRREPDPWTDEDYLEMWAGRVDAPEFVCELRRQRWKREAS